MDNLLEVDQTVLQESQTTSNSSGRLGDLCSNNLHYKCLLCRLLANLMDVAGSLPIPENVTEPLIISRMRFAVSVQEVDPQEFAGIMFSAQVDPDKPLNSSDLSFEPPQKEPTGAISLPGTLFEQTPQNMTRIATSVFLTDSLFLRRNNNSRVVDSIIIAASVVGVDGVKNLNPPVQTEFQRLNQVKQYV